MLPILWVCFVLLILLYAIDIHSSIFFFPSLVDPRICEQAIALKVYALFFKDGVDGIIGTTFDILEERLSFQA